MPDIQKAQIRNLVDGVYDIQKLRVATGNRIVASLRPTVLQSKKPDMTSEEKDKLQKEKDKLLSKILSEYKNITEYLVDKAVSDKSIASYGTTEYIKSKVDYVLVQNYMRLKAAEDGMAKVVAEHVYQHPLWDYFFKDVVGCGPMIAAICIAYLDPYKARHRSSFYRYCGLDVQTDSEGNLRGNGRWYTEMRPYTDKEGNEALKKSITYNPFIKSKLLEVFIGGCIRLNANEKLRGRVKYASIYQEHKHRQESYPEPPRPIVAHRRAVRYAAKAFLSDLWVAWRTLEGLEVTEPYAVAKLGMNLHGSDPSAE